MASPQEWEVVKTGGAGGDLILIGDQIAVLSQRMLPVTRLWMQAPGLVGLIAFTLGLYLLLASFVRLGDSGDPHYIWAGVALVVAGTASTTVTALVLRPQGPEIVDRHGPQVHSD